MAQIRKYTKEEIAEMLENSTLENVAARLKEDSDGSRGLSEKSLKRFCREEGILQNNTWSEVVSTSSFNFVKRLRSTFCGPDKPDQQKIR